MGWFWDKQLPSVRLCSCAYKHKRVLYQGGDERKRMKGTLSYLADDKKNDTHTHTTRVRLIRVHARQHTLPANVFESDRSFTLSLHSSLLSFYCFSSAHHTDKYVLTHTHTARTHAHCSHTQLTKTQKSFQRKAELQNLWCFNKTNCLFSCDEAPTAGANKYKHRYVGNKD